MKLYTLESNQFINKPIEEVFQFFSKPENLSVITPAKLGFKILSPNPIKMEVGRLIDYNIYLMSRLREESRRNNIDQATINTLASTGGVITSAGLILAGTFSALMTLPLQDLFQLGFAVAIGVLMDTFITRTLIVPSIVKLLGNWNWWPFTLKNNL